MTTQKPSYKIFAEALFGKEFKDDREYRSFCDWYHKTIGEERGFRASERVDHEELNARALVQTMREYYAHKRRDFYDDPENEARVASAILVECFGYPTPELATTKERERAKYYVAFRHWQGKRLRRQAPLDGGDLPKIAAYFFKEELASGLDAQTLSEIAERKASGYRRTIPSDKDGQAKFQQEATELLAGDRWRAWTYNEVADALNVVWSQALKTLNYAAAKGTDVLALVKTENGFKRAKAGERATHWRYCPERSGMAIEGRAYVLCGLVLRYVAAHPGASRRQLRAAMRDHLGGCRANDTDVALDRLAAHGLIALGDLGAGRTNAYRAAKIDRSEHAKRRNELRSALA